ncbi:ribbon-helix-helix protein, CopG family [Cetobacterium sp.]|uniref:ribbon-helix-helix protein, CopG family n=1 Tax=Cetobacterium sp. TaxID=2071632 RepID=UPI003F395697
MKSINIRLEESLIEEIKHVAHMYHKNMSDIIREGIAKVLEEKKNDIYYKLTDFPSCSQDETDEIMMELKSLSEDDLKIVKSEKVKI